MSTHLIPDPLAKTIQTATLTEALKAVLDHFECQAGTYHEFKDGVLQLTASCQIPPPVLEVIKQVPIGKGIAGLAAQRREPVSLCNLQTDSTGQARPGAKATGMEGSLAVPALTHSGELAGVLGIAKASAHDWTDAEKAAVTESAALIAARG